MTKILVGLLLALMAVASFAQAQVPGYVNERRVALTVEQVRCDTRYETFARWFGLPADVFKTHNGCTLNLPISSNGKFRWGPYANDAVPWTAVTPQESAAMIGVYFDLGNGFFLHAQKGCGGNAILFYGRKQVVIQGPKGDRGLQGARGERGPQGVQGQPGSCGPAGASGPQGECGPTGAPGAPGQPGVSVTKVWIDERCHLMVLLSNGCVQDAGYCRGPAGVDGKSTSCQQPVQQPIYNISLTPSVYPSAQLMGMYGATYNSHQLLGIGFSPPTRISVSATGGSVGPITNNNANTNVNNNVNNTVVNTGSGTATGSSDATGSGTSNSGR